MCLPSQNHSCSLILHTWPSFHVNPVVLHHFPWPQYRKDTSYFSAALFVLAMFDLNQTIWRHLSTMHSPGKYHNVFFKALQCISCWICWHMMGQVWSCYVMSSPKWNAFLYQCCVFSDCIPGWKMFLYICKRCLQTEVGGSPVLWKETTGTGCFMCLQVCSALVW